MNNLELISYKQTPHDKYTKALARVRITAMVPNFQGHLKEQRFIVNLFHKKLDDGREFWVPAGASIQEHEDPSVKKVNHKGFFYDSTSDDQFFFEWLRDAVSRYVQIKPAMEASVHAYNQQPQVQPQARSNAVDEQLPF